MARDANATFQYIETKYSIFEHQYFFCSSRIYSYIQIFIFEHSDIRIILSNVFGYSKKFNILLISS